VAVGMSTKQNKALVRRFLDEVYNRDNLNVGSLMKRLGSAWLRSAHRGSRLPKASRPHRPAARWRKRGMGHGVSQRTVRQLDGLIRNKGTGDGMRARPLLWRVVMTSVFLLASTACSKQSETRVLFIGNSYTSFNGGLDKGLEALSSSIETGRVVADGYTLEDHWNDGKALLRIREGGRGYVVLQEQSQLPVIGRDSFFEFARQFDAEIREAGATTVLLMTWERPDSIGAGVNTANLGERIQLCRDRIRGTGGSRGSGVRSFTS